MNVNFDEDNVWDTLISYVQVNPIDFKSLESEYEIGKL